MGLGTGHLAERGPRNVKSNTLNQCNTLQYFKSVQIPPETEAGAVVVAVTLEVDISSPVEIYLF